MTIKYVLAFLLCALPAIAAEYHVSVDGNDANTGTQVAPFRSIQHAAEQAQPGDVITVHEGIYRERINPPTGGHSDAERIVFQAAPDAEVVIKGSEVIEGWYPTGNDTWKTIIPNEFFGDFNPYKTRVRGDWFRPLPHDAKRRYHVGTVYLDGHWLKEAASLEDVLASATDDTLWFGEVDEKHTTLHAQFKGIDPNEHTIEINVREAVFYPEVTGINYITVRGFTMEHAAPNWAPPTAEQVGLIGTHWSKGWIIEDNVIRYSICTGITLGKHGDEYDNKSAWSAEGYVETIKRGLKRGWSKENIGSHVVRNNHISYCEQAGIVGSMGAAFSTISGNVIHDINMRRMFSGAEMAGIKFHGAVDSLIAHNHIYRCDGFGGIWLDWMTQGTRVTGNLLHDNTHSGKKSQDLFVEVNHGPFLIDNNIFLSEKTLLDQSTGAAYVHNIFAGRIPKVVPQSRETPYLKAHSTEIAGLSDTPGGDSRFINNLFLNGHDLSPYDEFENMTMQGNRFLDTEVKLRLKDGNAVLEFGPGLNSPDTVKRRLVISEDLGKTIIAGLPFKAPDGTRFTIDHDYFGQPRKTESPAAGPFGAHHDTAANLKVWPKPDGISSILSN
jgi:alpha-N-arabinofuranosidase